MVSKVLKHGGILSAAWFVAGGLYAGYARAVVLMVKSTRKAYGMRESHYQYKSSCETDPKECKVRTGPSTAIDVTEFAL